MVKLLLVNPLFANCVPIYPLGIAHVAAVCRNVAKVSCLDMNLLKEPFVEVSQVLVNYKPDFIGVGLRNLETTDDYFSYLPSFWSLVSMIKQVLPKCRVIVGGSGFSIMPKQIMQSHSGIDFGITGPGETILPLLSADAQSNTYKMWYRDGEIIHQPGDTTNDTNFCWYPYELLDEIIPVDNYWQTNPEYGIGIQTKRGCGRKCSYCVYPQLEGENLCSRSTEEILADISFLYKKGVTRFFVSDSVANDLPEKFHNLCSEIKKMSLPITWGGWFREDQISTESATLAHEAGCDWFSFSPDGSCQAHLKLLKKDLTIEKIKQAAKICAKLPVRTMFHFFTYLPNETKQTIRQSYQNIKELHQLFVGRPEFVGVTCKNIRVYQGTDFYKTISQAGEKLPERLLLPYFYNPAPYNKLRCIFEAVCAMMLAQVKQNNSDFNDIDDYFLTLTENNLQN